MGELEISKQIEKLDTSSDKAAEKVIQKLVSIGKPAVAPLIKAAKNKDTPRVRKWSLQALGAIGDKRSALMTVRLHALKGLRRMKYKKGVPQIASLLKDESGGIRANALYALTELGDPSVFSQIQKLLSDELWYIRQAASTACGELGIEKAKRKLAELSKTDERKAVGEAAHNALEELRAL